MTRSSRCLLLLILPVLLVGTAAWSAEPIQHEMGSQGEIYRLWSGEYGQIFPNGNEASPDHPVLALEREETDGSLYRSLVPGTEDAEPETFPLMVVEDSSEALYLIWVIRHNVVHSQVKVVGFGPNGFSDPIDIGQSPFGIKSDPGLSVTRSRAVVTVGEDQELTYDRTVLHLAWWEETGSGPRHIYSPVVLLNGVYVGRNLLVDLGSVVTEDLSGQVPEAPAGFYTAPWVTDGADSDTALVAFADDATQTLSAVRVRVLPSDLSSLADRARAQIIFWGESQLRDASDRPELADRARAQIIFWARDMHTSLQEFLAEDVRQAILEDPAEDLYSLAERARAQIIFWGATACSSRLPQDLLAASVWMEMEGLGVPGVDSQIVEVTPISQRTVPPVENEGFHLFLSPDGQNVLAAWETPEALRYVVSEGSEWSQVDALRLSPSLDLQRGLEILERLISRH